MISIFLSKFLGFIYRMQFVRLTGEETVGIYMTAYPAFIFFLSIVQLGIPTAMSKIIAELRTRNAVSDYFAVMRTSVIVTVIAILIFTPLFIFVTPFISENLLKNDAITMTLYVSIAIAPIAAAGGLLKGFFQGIARIEETAVSQLMEQIIRILLISFLLPILLTSTTPREAAAYAMLMSLIAEVAAVLYLRWKYVKWKAKQNTNRNTTSTYPLNPLFSIAIPSSGSRLFGSFTWFLEPIIFIKALAVTGVTAVSPPPPCTELFLVYLFHFCCSLLSSLTHCLLFSYLLSVMHYARNNLKLLKERIHLSLKFSTLTGCYAATLFYLHGGELGRALYFTLKM